MYGQVFELEKLFEQANKRFLEKNPMLLKCRYLKERCAEH